MLVKGIRFIFSPEGCAPRAYGPLGGKIFVGITFLFALYNLAMLSGNLWGIDPILHYWIYLFSLLVIAFYHYSPTGNAVKKIGVEGTILIAVSLLTVVYLVRNSEALLQRASLSLPLPAIDVAVGCVTFVLVAEAARRVVGMVMATLSGMFLVYAWVGKIWPWGFSHSGLSFRDMAATFFMGPSGDGLWAMPLSISATTLILLFLFGGLFQALGGGHLFVRLALALLGKYRGGAAKMCILASALFGMVTGGGATGVAIIGTFTIPAMIKTGYKRHYAGAVESVASTGAAFTPPVMGAVAFIMAEFLGMPYSKLLLPAAIPALLYYLSCFVQADCQASMLGLRGLSRDEIPKIGDVLKESGEFFIPLMVLILFLLLGYTTNRAALMAIAGNLLAGAIRGKNRAALPRNFVKGLSRGVQTSLLIAFTCALAGTIMTSIGITGFGGKFTHMVGLLSGKSLFLTLIAAALMCVILGTGLSITVSYILTVLLVIPVAVGAGVLPLAAHMFAVYYAVLADISPPVALACFVASGIAQVDSFKIGWTAMRLAIAAYILPFVFVYKPALLLLGSAQETFWAIITAGLALVYLGMALEGWVLKRKATLLERGLLFCGAVGLFMPGAATNLVGTLIGVLPVVRGGGVLSGRGQLGKAIHRSGGGG
jgi:TRAP transporter 4TM/12TM fusion protein